MLRIFGVETEGAGNVAHCLEKTRRICYLSRNESCTRLKVRNESHTIMSDLFIDFIDWVSMMGLCRAE